MAEKKKFAILGAGNSGQTYAGYLTMKGYPVGLFDFFEDTVRAINEKGSIEISGAIEATIPFENASTDIKSVVQDAAVIMIINPALYHRKLAGELARCLTPEQIVFINPASTFGAFAFKKALMDNGYDKDVVLAESNTSLFACRLSEPGKSFIGGKKDRILVSPFPAQGNMDRLVDVLGEAIPEIQPVRNVISTSMDNTNPGVHPAPMILNCSWVESGQKFSFMHEAVGPTVEKILEKMDAERIALGQKLGLTLGKDLFTLIMQYEQEYRVSGTTGLAETFKACKTYDKIYSPNSLQHRYITEDVPAGLTPLADVGEQVGVPMEKTRLIVDICEKVLEQDFTKGENCRSAANLGIAGMSAEEIVHYAETGRKK